MDKFLSSDLDAVTLLFLFITGLLTKRFVPWWVYEDALKKLQAYEDATPELVTEVRRLMSLMGEAETGTVRRKGQKVEHLKASPKILSATQDRVRQKILSRKGKVSNA